MCENVITFVRKMCKNMIIVVGKMCAVIDLYYKLLYIKDGDNNEKKNI